MWSLDKHNSLSPFCPPQFLLTAEEKESSWLSHEQTVNEVTFDALCQPNSSLSSRPPQQSTHKITAGSFIEELSSVLFSHMLVFFVEVLFLVLRTPLLFHFSLSLFTIHRI